MALTLETFRWALAALTAAGVVSACQGELAGTHSTSSGGGAGTGGAAGSGGQAVTGGTAGSGGGAGVVTGGGSGVGGVASGGAPSGGTGGTPACGVGTLDCQGECVDPMTDTRHCGSCGVLCGAAETCQGGSCLCPGGLLACGESCVNAQNDNANCGACGTTCATGSSCNAGSCVCLSGSTACGMTCTNLDSDPANCGTCGNVCSGGQLCSGGTCSVSCGSGLTPCGQSCVDLNTHNSNCGACGNVCPGGRMCEAGACRCAGGLTECDGACVDTDTSAADCGSCNNSCAQGQTCNDGSCACPNNQTLCGGTCVNTQTSNNNCGTCGNACSGGRSCTSGSCSCPNGQTWCNNACVDTESDTGNCGGCGTQCSTGQSCSNGTCSGGGTSGDVFSECRFHFGAIDQFARNNSALAAQLDYFTPGWMGVRDTFDQGYVCDDTEPGGPLAGKVPVVVAYVAAFYAKRHRSLCDCNVTSCGQNNDLCHQGSAYIQQNLNAILGVYRSYAQGYASCYGTTRPIVFEMEPDWYQYTNTSTQTDAMTPSEAANIMGQFVAAIKQYLPNAVFSMDISPWVAPNNGRDNGAQWYGNFDMSQFTFINTSGGSTQAGAARIRSANEMTWAGVSQATGKPILADTGYGVNGTSAGHDSAWDNVGNLNARINDGVVGIAQYNPNSGWGGTISSIRGQLGTPRFCP